MTKPTKRVEAETVARKVLKRLNVLVKNGYDPKGGTWSARIDGEWLVATQAELRAICEELVKRGTQ